MDTLHLARQIASEALDTKVQDLKILDLRKLASFADYFVLGTGTSDRHVKAIADRVHLKVKKEYGLLPISYEGYSSGQWVLLDYGDVVLHVFLEGQRQYYGLDEFWEKAPELAVDPESPPPAVAAKPRMAPALAAKPKPKAKTKAKTKIKPKAPRRPAKKSKPSKKKKK